MAKSKNRIEVIEGAKIVTIEKTNGSTPALLFEGAEPEAGAVIHAKLANGVTYAGKVALATVADGQVLAEFEGGLTPL